MPRKIDKRTQAKLDAVWLEYYRNQAREMLREGALSRCWHTTGRDGKVNYIKADYHCKSGTVISLK